MALGLADLFKAGTVAVQFRVGQVVSWDSVTGENEITVANTTVTDLPVLYTTALPSISENDTVGLLWVGDRYVVLGQILNPPI